MPKNMKKLVITADIHANLEALDKLPAGKVICCGDLVGYGADPNIVVEMISGADWTCAMGNHDWAALTKETKGMNSFAKESALWTFNQISPNNRKYLAGLPRTKILEIEGKSILVVHGSPRDALNEYIFNPETVKMLLKAIRTMQEVK